MSTIMGSRSPLVKKSIISSPIERLQKSEKGSSRISANRLYRLAQALDVPIAYFFEGIEGAVPRFDEAENENVLTKKETMTLLRHYYGIKVEGVRLRAGELLRSMAPTERQD